MTKKVRFSYVEILVMAVILGIISRTIVPQFSEASTEEKISQLVDDLEQMRAQLDLYRVQHGDYLPPADSFDSFETAMTTKSGRCGPYVEKIPTNPFNDLNTVRFDGEPAGANKAGWRFDTESGLFQADNSISHAGL
jgi:type II secretory pathway pseudopilin PulG